MTTTEQFSLRWNNFHSNLTSGFHDLLQANDMVDVTLAVEGQFLQAHKIVLSICSPMFKEMFKINPCRHPVIILRDVSYNNLKDILEFMYLGEVNVLRDNLSAFLRTAELLQVKGLTGDDSSDTSSKQDEKLDSTSENDMEADISQFSQLLESSEPPSVQQYPQLPSPPSTSTQPVLPNTKRVSKPHGGSSKKAKSDTFSPVKNIKKEDPYDFNTSKHSEDEPDYMESKADIYVSENDEMVSKDVIKQLLESNNVNLAGGHDSTSQDHDTLMCSTDAKGHVYCPYCYRKFVNRYNLKVHIRDKHENNTLNLDCIICGKTMRNRSCLRVHLYHHRKQQLQAEQEQGNSKRLKPKELVKCLLCKKGILKCNLKAHIQNIHDNNNSKVRASVL